MDNHAHAHHHKHMYFCLFNCLFVYLRLLSVIVVQQKLYFHADKYRWYRNRKYEKANQNYIYKQKRIKSLSSEVFHIKINE